MADQVHLSQHRNPRSLMSRGMIFYFVILFVLTCMAFIPGVITLGVLLFILPGLILIASPTLLAYSTALLPAYFINRHLGKRLLAAGVAVLGLAAAAVLPHYIDGYRLGRLVAADVSHPPTSFQPRSFELPYLPADIYWTTWRGQPLVMPPPPCADLCQQLLFKGNVDQVFVFGTSREDPMTNGTIVITAGKVYRIPAGAKRTIRPADLPHDSSAQEISFQQATHPKQEWRRFRLERQETCPVTLSIVKYAPEGRCLIEDIVERSDADVVVSIAEAPRPPQHFGPTDPCQSLAYRGIQQGPTTVTLAERHDGKLTPVEIRTTLVALYAAIPFYFDVRPMGGNLAELCLGVVTDPFPRSFADPYDMIARRYGLPIARTPESDRPPRAR